MTGSAIQVNALDPQIFTRLFPPLVQILFPEWLARPAAGNPFLMPEKWQIRKTDRERTDKLNIFRQNRDELFLAFFGMTNQKDPQAQLNILFLHLNKLTWSDSDISSQPLDTHPDFRVYRIANPSDFLDNSFLGNLVDDFTKAELIPDRRKFRKLCRNNYLTILQPGPERMETRLHVRFCFFGNSQGVKKVFKI
ncbi:MAG: hypothetical protein A2511_14820 [Deltaproteobacteria bacterium RIFOXYD12_FULL_50_9]|nr:MAG: hypothetical protein A2511_14820 [Deltaproteobacteria bacterium RIFOXYD12_FULL_50_9]